MTGPKTNERPGTRAVLRHFHMSASKARIVLDLVRGVEADRAAEILNNTPREAAQVIAKVLASAVANAAHNDGLAAEDLYISACYADEGATMKRWRPRARGRASRINKRTCHITVIVDRMDDERISRRLAAQQAAGAQRSRRVAESRRRADQQGRGRRRDAAREAEIEAEAAAAAEAELEDAETTETELSDEAVAETATTETVEAESSDEIEASSDGAPTEASDDNETAAETDADDNKKDA